MQTIYGYKAALVLEDEFGNDLTIPNALGDPTGSGMVNININRVLDAISDAQLRGEFGCGTRGHRVYGRPFLDDSVLIEGMYPKGRWQAWTTKQDKLWVDGKGNVHRIDKMPKDYCLNVIQFLYENHRRDLGDPRTNPLIRALRERLI